MKIVDWLDRPYPYVLSSSMKLWLSLGIGLVCFLFLAVFRPFGLHEVTDLSFIGLFGLNATWSLLIHFFVLPLLIPAWFDASRWKIKRQLLLLASILLLITLFNYVLNSTVGRLISPQYGFLAFVFMTCAVGVLPVLIMTYVIELVSRRRNEVSASVLTAGLQDSAKDSFGVNTSDPKLSISGENTSDPILELQPEDFLYALAAGNYVEIYHLQDGVVDTSLLRLSLKGLQQQLGEHKQFLRCHKSYVVNRQQISGVHGNARSLVISLRHVDVEIPVSRSFDKLALTT